MKHWLIYLVFSFSATVVCGQSPSSVRISGSVADSLDAEGRMAYLFTYFDNQAAFIDSCRICGGRFMLEGRIPFDEVAAEVLIERVPLSSGSIVVRSGDRIDFAFAPLGRMGRPEVSGSESQEELCRILGAPVAALRKRLQAELLHLSPDDERRAALETRIDSWFHREGLLWRELLWTTRSGFNAVYACLNLLSDLSESEQAETYAYIRTKFPDNANLSMLTGTTPSGKPIPAMTPESREAFNRYARIVGDPLPYPDTTEEDAGFELSIAPPGSTLTDADNPTDASEDKPAIPYRCGDAVVSFSLPDREGKETSWRSLRTPYVLIDFWASWCDPCREEMPGLLAAARDYEGTLAVYAVSIDKNLNRWKQAVEADGSGTAMTHVILRKDNPDCDRLFRMFGIETIPHNFLLDADGKALPWWEQNRVRQLISSTKTQKGIRK
ncbi:MAG: AhpC/TSA family protein [Alistipes sp.]|nr:AhpC/TSA family protein [Alistipes sp.]